MALLEIMRIDDVVIGKSRFTSIPKDNVHPPCKGVFDNNSETEAYLKKFFEKAEKVGKDISFENRKTILKSKILPTDKICEVSVVNGESATDYTFVSVSFKFIAEREIKTIAKDYLYILCDRRYPVIVERKYLEDPKYREQKVHILNEFS